MCALGLNWQQLERPDIQIVDRAISQARPKANDMSGRYQRIHDVLTNRFSPLELEIIDETAKHAGHAGQIGVVGGETHYRVAMVSAALAGLSRLQRSRAVHDLLQAEFNTGLHAISLSLRTPGEI